MTPETPSPSVTTVGERRDAIALTGFTYRVSDEAKAKMRARDDRCRRAGLYYKDIMFR